MLIVVKFETFQLKVLPVQGDLETDEDVKTLLGTTIKHYGKLDILVNNAGISGLGTIENTSLDLFDQIMRINVRSVFYLTSLAVPFLTPTQGCIVNVSSVNGLSFQEFWPTICQKVLWIN